MILCLSRIWLRRTLTWKHWHKSIISIWKEDLYYWQLFPICNCSFGIWLNFDAVFVPPYALLVTLFSAGSRIFLPIAKSWAALFCCHLAIRASSLGWLVGNYYVLLLVTLPLKPQLDQLKSTLHAESLWSFVDQQLIKGFWRCWQSRSSFLTHT